MTLQLDGFLALNPVLPQAYESVTIDYSIYFVLDLNGGWSEWFENKEKSKEENCIVKERKCNKPSKCGDGSDCIGPAIQKIGCKGIYFDFSWLSLNFSKKIMEIGVCGPVGHLVQNHVDMEHKLDQDCATILHLQMMGQTVLVLV